MDKIQLQNISINSILGCYPEEQNVHRPVKISLTLYTDITRAAASGELCDAIDYDSLTQAVIDFGEGNAFTLIETLAEKIAALCFEKTTIEAVDVTVTKPHPRSRLEQASVIIHRERK